MKQANTIKLATLVLTVLTCITLATPVMAIIDVGASFGGAPYTNLGSKFTLTLSITTKGNNSKKQSCGRTYMSIGAANMKIIDAKLGDVPNSSIEKTTDGAYVIQNSSKYDCIPDGTHLVATFTAETINSGDASIYSTNGSAMIANITTTLKPKTVTVYSDVCPEGKTGIPPDCKVMGELTDVCPNVGGVQTVVPENMKKDDAGNCVGTGENISENTENTVVSYQHVNLKSEEPDETGSIDQVTYFPSIDSIFLQWSVSNGLTNMKVDYSKPGETPIPIESPPTVDGATASLTISGLDVFTDYEIIITGKNSQGETVQYAGIAKTRGYPIEIIVKQSNAVMSGAKVTIAGASVTTDSRGSAKYETASGKVSVDVEIDGVKETHVIDVKNMAANESTGSRERQEFTLDIASPSTISIWIYVAIAGFLIVMGVSLGLLVHRHNRRKHLRDSAEYQNVGVPPPAQPPFIQNQ